MVDDVGKTKQRIGLVLSGGGARGAYEAGVMSVLGPALDQRGERPSIYIGTCVGAVNATYQAAAAHLPAEEEAAGGVERWRQVQKNTIMRPILLRQAPAHRGPLPRRDHVPPRRAPAEPARPEAVRAQPRSLDRLGGPAPQRRVGGGRRGRHRRDGRAHGPHRRVRRGSPRTGHPSLARDRLRADATGRAPRARLGCDPDPLPAGARRRAARCARLVRRRRHPAEHPDQAGARPRRRTLGGGRDRLGRRALEPPRPPRHGAARLRRRRAARPAGHARRPGRRGHAHPRQHQHVLR